MAGTISLSFSQQFDEDGVPLSGGTLQFIQAGTVATPQNAYQDEALTIAYPNPITLDSAGRIPAFYLADGYIKVVLRDVSGVVQREADFLMVVGPSSGGGGGGGGSVDPTTVHKTGDPIIRFDNSAVDGAVRANGRTIGPVGSSGTERENADTQALFLYLWNNFDDTRCPVTPGGRGVSAAADWAAGNKAIKLLDARGRALVGVADMGNSDSGRLDNVTFAVGNKTTAASTGGAARKTLIKAELPAVAPTGSVAIDEHGGHDHDAYYQDGSNGNAGSGVPLSNFGPNATGRNTSFKTAKATTGITAAFTGDNLGSGTAFDLMNPFITVYCWLKL